MDGCPRRGDPSFPGWIITLWLKFAFNCTALPVSFLVVLTSPLQAPLHTAWILVALDLRPPWSPRPNPFAPSSHLLDSGSQWAGGCCLSGALGTAAGAKVLSSGSFVSGTKVTVVEFHSPLHVATEHQCLPWQSVDLWMGPQRRGRRMCTYHIGVLLSLFSPGGGHAEA